MSTSEMDLARANGLGDVLRRSAARFRDKVAIIDGARTLTFTELDDLVTRVAAGLAERGVGQGDRVALLSRNSADFAAVTWGCARLGAILVPINFMLSPEDIAYILRDAEPIAFITQPEFSATAIEAIVESGLTVPTRVLTDTPTAADTPSAPNDDWVGIDAITSIDASAWAPPSSPTTTRSG